MRKVRTHMKIYTKRWHLVVTFLFIIVPFVFMIAVAKIEHIVISTLLLDLWSSLWRMCVAYVIAAGLGWFLAVCFFEGKRASVALPIFDVLQSFPTFAALPLVTLFLGTTNLTVIFYLVLTIIWPIIFTILSSLRLVKHDWREAIDISNVRGWNYIRYFLWPVTIPALITGSIIGMGNAWEALIATEIIIHIKYGLGNFFQAYSHSFFITTAAILGFLLIIFSINKLVWQPLLMWSHAKLEE